MLGRVSHLIAGSVPRTDEAPVGRSDARVLKDY